MKQSVNFVLISVAIMTMAFLSGCNKSKEKDIVGQWESTQTVDGEAAVSTLEFNEDKTFKQSLVPFNPDMIGFSVEGTWKFDLMGDLKIHYRESSLKAVSSGYTDEMSKNVYLAQMRAQLKLQNSDNGVIPVKFSDNGMTMVLTTTDGKQAYGRKEANSSAIMGRNARFELGGQLPRNGSLDQFEVLSSRRISDSEISGYSSSELRILRNAIYARNGYIFKSQDMQQYFGNFSDYTPRTSNAVLSAIEQANVNTIRAHE